MDQAIINNTFAAIVSNWDFPVLQDAVEDEAKELADMKSELLACNNIVEHVPSFDANVARPILAELLKISIRANRVATIMKNKLDRHRASLAKIIEAIAALQSNQPK